MLMKKIIIMITFLIILSNLAVGEQTPHAEVKIEIKTDGDIDSTIVEVAKGDIDNKIYCHADGDCNYNLYNGKVNIPEGEEGLYQISSYQYNSYIANGGSGFSLSKLNGQLYAVKDDYVKGVKKTMGRWDVWDFLSLLSGIFVTRTEYNTLFGNVIYLANEVDVLKAENNILRSHLNITDIDKEKLDCQIAIQKAYRYGTRIMTPSGMVADPERYGNVCITVTS